MIMVADRPVLSRNTLPEFHNWLEGARSDGAVALIDKEEQWTSFDCVAKLRGITRVKRVGHAGTLDPLATGLLVLCFGKATKDIALFQDEEKTYDVDILLGAESTTDDRAGDIAVTEVVNQPTKEEINEQLMRFVGTISQTPPAFSAVRHNGVRQYDLARSGKDFTPKVRQVEVYAIENVIIEWPHVQCTVRCAKGTYIRSIARDLGVALGCGGYVHSLRRTRSGGFLVEHALRIEEVQQALVPVVVA